MAFLWQGASVPGLPLRHRAWGGRVHASGQGLGIVGAATDVGEDQQPMAMEGPVAAQLLPQIRGQGHDAVAVTFAVADEELVLAAEDVVDCESEALAQAQAAAIDELERGAVTAQTDGAEQIADLVAREDGGQGVVIAGADLGKEGPIGVTQQLHEEHSGGGQRLAEGFGLPLFLELEEEEIVAQLGFAEGGRE